MSKMVSVAALRDEMACGQGPQMIDVRTASEYSRGHIPNTVNIPMDQFEARRKDLRLEKGVVLICKAGSRAQTVAGWLGDNAAVRVLEGGTDAWRGDGLAVVIPVKPHWSVERQVRLVAGALVLTGAGLAVAGVHGAIWLAMLVGAGLTFAGLTDICPMGILLAKIPWRQIPAGDEASEDSKASNCCCR